MYQHQDWLKMSCRLQIDNFPGVPTMVLTATATPRVKQDIVSSLIIPRCRYFQVTPSIHLTAGGLVCCAA